ncbi:DeoR/GlpR family DNA-binding transcription regulator [uncultured Anaerofustis sp.]|uniref:DeoR/GlpR family DNA-binding transcription regulator n=1 Tax=uncultured Anaerofustis sp. TaxID=904996 RepID=UPI0025EEA4B3|nr:DeoR/GlpR family DNA-binding transcription regulator [uncultured Anaerofustis sp.]
MNKVEERQRKIMDILKENKHITINELGEMLNVSHLTIRRDLKTLEESQNITISYGGIVFSNEDFSQYSKRECENLELKSRIAKKALNYVEDNDIIYIGGGSTCVEFAKSLFENKPNLNIKIITSCANVAKITSKMMFANITLVGGNFINENESMVSLFTLDVIKTLNFNKAFLGCLGLTDEKGAMFIDITLAKLKKIIAKNSQNVIVLCDYTKIGKHSMATGLNIDDIDIIITNKNAQDLNDYGFIKKHEVKVDLV